MPEKLTKPAEVSKFQRMELADQRWREKVEAWMLEVDEIETEEVLDVWKAEHRIDIGSIPERHHDLKQAVYKKVRLKGEELMADKVVHDTDDMDPRPFRPDDYDEDEGQPFPIARSRCGKSNENRLLG